MKKLVMLGVMLLLAYPAYADNSDRFDYGVGADVVLYNGNDVIDEVRVDTRYNIDEQETSVYGVVKVDLFGAIAGR